MLYKNLYIEDINQAASDQEIQLLEQTLEASLPEDYKDFLRICNGGYLEYEIEITFEDGNSEYMCYGSLYQLNSSETWESNPFELKNERGVEGFPEKVLPIARDGGSSKLFLDLRDGGGVIAYLQGLPGWTGLRQTDCLVKVADTFTEYLSKLQITDLMVKDHIESMHLTEEAIKLTMEWFDSGAEGWRNKFKDEWNKRVETHQI